MTHPRPLEDRVWEKVAFGDWLDCWTWTAGLDRAGYGRIQGTVDEGRPTKGAHRVTYELLAGPIPDGLHIDHLCRNPSCVNPLHLEPVTLKENLRRGLKGVLKSMHCPQGHEFTPENTRIKRNGHRQCRACEQSARPSSLPTREQGAVMDEQTRLHLELLDTLIESTVAALEAARALRLAIERREHPSLPGFTPDPTRDRFHYELKPLEGGPIVVDETVRPTVVWLGDGAA